VRSPQGWWDEVLEWLFFFPSSRHPVKSFTGSRRFARNPVKKSHTHWRDPVAFFTGSREKPRDPVKNRRVVPSKIDGIPSKITGSRGKFFTMK